MLPAGRAPGQSSLDAALPNHARGLLLGHPSLPPSLLLLLLLFHSFLSLLVVVVVWVDPVRGHGSQRSERAHEWFARARPRARS